MPVFFPAREQTETDREYAISSAIRKETETETDRDREKVVAEDNRPSSCIFPVSSSFFVLLLLL